VIRAVGTRYGYQIAGVMAGHPILAGRRLQSELDLFGRRSEDCEIVQTGLKTGDSAQPFESFVPVVPRAVATGARSGGSA
jgi:hypothetical protein